MKKILMRGVCLLIISAVALGFVFRARIQRVRMVASLFSGAEQDALFCRVADFFPHASLTAPAASYPFPRGAEIELPAVFFYAGREVATDLFLQETDTAAMLVVKDGEIQFEKYMLTGGPTVPWLSMSVAKSFVSALVGVAVDEGKIESIDDPVTKYVPSLSRSGYDGVRIKDVLQMSSGVRWNEDYSNPGSDINRFGRIFALGGSLDDFAATLQRAREPGTFNQYNSIDTQVLGMLLVRATGRSITDYMADKLWHPIGAESAAHWLVDSDGMEMVFGGFNATARDYAKFGELYRLQGRWHGRQLISAEWVAASVTPDAPHLRPGKDNAASDFELGYGYQWWVPEGDAGEYCAIGVYNQFIYVNPACGTVIVKLSANSDYGLTDHESSYRELETIEFFRAIAQAICRSPGR